MQKRNYKYKISIILCTYQSMSSLAHSLSNVLLQDMPKKDYEVIAIAHGVEDAISGHLFHYVQNLKRYYCPRLEDMHYQPNFVRNQGIKMAEGKLVLFLHDNVDLIGKDWLRQLWRDSEYGECAVMTHKIVYRYNKDGGIGRDDDIHGFYAQQDAIPRKYLTLVGGFDEAYDGDAGMDDIDLKKRCQRETDCEFVLSNLLSIKHNLRDLYPPQITITNYNGARNRKIFEDKGFTAP